MMKISEAIKLQEKKYQEGLKKCNCFFAFSKEQFNENKIPSNAPEEEFISCGGGMYIHKSNEDKLNHFINEEQKKLTREFLENIDQKELIYYELINHENFYTEQPEDILQIVKCYYSNEDEKTLMKKILEVYQEKRKEQTIK